MSMILLRLSIDSSLRASDGKQRGQADDKVAVFESIIVRTSCPKEWVWKFSPLITDYLLSDCLFEWVQLAT